MRAMIIARPYANPSDRGKLRALAGLGAELTVLVPDVSGSRARSRFESEGSTRVIPVPARGDLAQPEELRWSGRAIRRAIRDVRPELIQVEEEPWSIAARQAAREAKRAQVPLVTFSRIPWPERLPSGSALRRRRVMSLASAAVASNTLAARALRSLFPDLPVAVVPLHGVDVPSAPVTRSGDTLNIGFIGRLVPERALDVVLRAVVPLGPGWRLFVSGTGPEQIALEALAERLGIAGNVSWLGAQPRAQRLALLSELDLLVSVPRPTEGWQELSATPVMLAMAHGIPVIGSRNGILTELLDGAGMVVPPDEVEPLATAMTELAGDSARRHEIGSAGRKRAQEAFSLPAVAQSTLELWQQLAVSV